MLEDLPVEVIQAIISFVHTAHDLASLSRACKRLHTLVNEDDEGWRLFALSRFPSLAGEGPLSGWRSRAHALTTLSRNIDRRAFVATRIQPQNVLFLTHGIRKERYSKPRTQTMGYRAIVDCYEDDAGREVLAWGAGADLLIRRSAAGPSDDSQSPDDRPPDRKARVDEWWAYQERLYREGLHDITTVHVLPNSHRLDHDAASEDLLVGRANGDLDLIDLHAGGRRVRRSFVTDGATVRAADLSGPTANLVATALGAHDLALYPLHGPDEAQTLPVSRLPGPSVRQTAYAWSVKLLGDAHLAVGRGPSQRIVHIHAITPTGLSGQPTRELSASADGENGASANPPRATSAYPLAALPATAADPDGPMHAQLLLSGGYDGRIRLHDLRAPEDVALAFADPIDRAAVFSLLALGRERLAAGSALNGLLKVFDLRLAGGRTYSYLSAIPSSPAPDNERAGAFSGGDAHRWLASGADSPAPSGANIFLGAASAATGAGASRQIHSPVYTLARGTALSPVVYAGLEGAVHAVNFTSANDAFPDARFAQGLRLTGAGRARRVDPVATWGVDRGAQLCLSLYEQRGDRHMRILTQRALGTMAKGSGLEAPSGYDERLSDAYNDRDVRPARRAVHGRGRGRGRGRGSRDGQH